MKPLSLVLPLFLLVLACQPKESVKTDEELKALANELTHKYILTDGHIDLPYRLKEEGGAINEGIIGADDTKPVGDFDVLRARQGGLDAPFMSIYIPSGYQKKNEKGELIGGGKELADSLINMVESIVSQYPENYALAKTPADIEQNFKDGKISLPMGMENGAPI